MLALAGCGSTSGSGKVYTTETPTEKAGTSITITSSGDTNLDYAYADNGSIIIGNENQDFNIVTDEGYMVNNDYHPEDNSSTGGVNANGMPTCPGGNQENCEDGYFWCPIEQKCLPA